MRPRLSLAGQFLTFQLGIVLLVVAVVAGVSLTQADIAFRRDEGRRLLSIAESVAANPSVRRGLDGNLRLRDALPAIGERNTVMGGLSSVAIADADGVLVNGPDMHHRIDLGGSDVLQGRSWTGTATRGSLTLLIAQAPVISDDQEVVGLVSAERTYPTLTEQFAAAVPDLLTYLLLGGIVGVGGSLLLARRVKRQTLGLEPREIVGLMEHREAMLHGIREGVIRPRSERPDHAGQ